MLTINDNKLKRTDLTDIKPVRPPNAGDQWRGIKHSIIGLRLEELLKAAGYTYQRERYVVTRAGADLVGCFEVSNATTIPRGWNACLGVTSSNARRGTLALWVGMQHLDDHEPRRRYGMVFGCARMAHKHTLELDLPKQLLATFNRWQRGIAACAQRHALLAAAHATGALYPQLLTAARVAGVPWRAMPHAFAHLNGLTATITLWDVLLAIGCAAMHVAPTKQLNIQYKAYRFLKAQADSKSEAA